MASLWGVKEILHGFMDSLQNERELKTYFEKVGKVMTRNLLEDTPQIFSYGFSVATTDSWKQFTPEEFEALTKFERLVASPYEPHQLLGRPG